ncbi:hypothetical protein F5883DRAFT_118537 [Diaporthe sp. PMI_573]|nr:hypothetical protein F5883DRAFT_118537 [Diaporthaceae sp. PMI_573]
MRGKAQAVQVQHNDVARKRRGRSGSSPCFRNAVRKRRQQQQQSEGGAAPRSRPRRGAGDREQTDRQTDRDVNVNVIRSLFMKGRYRPRWQRGTEQSVGGVQGRPSVLSCRVACLIPSVSPSLHHSPSTLTVSVLPLFPHTLPLSPPVPPPSHPSLVIGHPCPLRILAVSGFTCTLPRQRPPAQPQTIPNPPSSKPAPFPKTNLSPRPVRPSRSYTRLSVLTVYFFPSWQVLSCLGMPLNEPIPFFYTSFFPALGSPREPPTS